MLSVGFERCSEYYYCYYWYLYHLYYHIMYNLLLLLLLLLIAAITTTSHKKSSLITEHSLYLGNYHTYAFPSYHTSIIFILWAIEKKVDFIFYLPLTTKFTDLFFLLNVPLREASLWKENRIFCHSLSFFEFL